MTVMDRDACANLGFLATPEQIADAFKATGIPKAPDVRPVADELRDIPDPKPSTAVENVSLAIGLATVAGVLSGFLS